MSNKEANFSGRRDGKTSHAEKQARTRQRTYADVLRNCMKQKCLRGIRGVMPHACQT
jgi:hypothetical protein